MASILAACGIAGAETPSDMAKTLLERWGKEAREWWVCNPAETAGTLWIYPISSRN